MLGEESDAPVEIVAQRRPPPLKEIEVLGEESDAPVEIMA